MSAGQKLGLLPCFHGDELNPLGKRTYLFVLVVSLLKSNWFLGSAEMGAEIKATSIRLPKLTSFDLPDLTFKPLLSMCVQSVREASVSAI